MGHYLRNFKDRTPPLLNIPTGNGQGYGIREQGYLTLFTRIHYILLG